MKAKLLSTRYKKKHFRISQGAFEKYWAKVEQLKLDKEETKESNEIIELPTETNMELTNGNLILSLGNKYADNFVEQINLKPKEIKQEKKVIHPWQVFFKRVL